MRDVKGKDMGCSEVRLTKCCAEDIAKSGDKVVFNTWAGKRLGSWLKRRSPWWGPNPFVVFR